MAPRTTRLLSWVWAPLVGAAGVAVAAGHWSRPHAASGRPLVSLRETVLSTGMPATLLVALGIVGLLWWCCARLVATRVGTSLQRAREALLPAVVGPGTATAAAALDAVAFRCTAPALLGLGTGLGLVAGWTAVAREARRTSSDRPDPGGWEGVSLLLVTAAAVALPLALLPGWSGPTGDEPHYLVVSHSLLDDGDLDVGDEYADASYRRFHPASLSPHHKPGRREGSRYSMHGVGLPLLLLPAYAAGEALEAGHVALPRLLLVLLYGGFAGVLFRLLQEIAGRRVALAGTLATTLTAPLVFSPLYLFPEVPAMLLGCLAFSGIRRSARPGGGASATTAVAVALLPWLGVKYIPLAVALVVGSWPWGRIGRGTGGERGAPMATAGLATAALTCTLVAHGAWTWSLYGSVSPLSVYLGSPASGTATPALGGDLAAYLGAWPGALATAIGYLADQKEGLLIYGPHFLLAAAGLPWLWRHRRRDLAFLGLLVVAHVGPYALSQQLSGQGPPVRPLMAVLWVVAVPLGVALGLPAGSALRAARGGLLALAASLTGLLALDPALLPHDYPVQASRLVRALSPQGAGWWRVFPQWVNVEAPNPWATAAVTGLLLAAGAWLLWLGSRTTPHAGSIHPLATAPRAGSIRPSATPLAAAVVLGACAGGVLVSRASVVVTDLHRPTRMSAGLTAWVEERLPERLWAEEDGIWVGPGPAMEFVLTAPRRVDRLAVRLDSIVETPASVWIPGDRLAGTARPGFAVVGTLEPAAGWEWRGRPAWQVHLRAGRGAAPADLGPSRDERRLGAFLQFDAVVPASPRENR